MKITVHKRSYYGTERLVVRDEPQATAMTALTGKRTLDDRDLDHLRTLGVNVEKCAHCGGDCK